MINFDITDFKKKSSSYALIIPTYNEGDRLLKQLSSIQTAIPELDIIIADAPSNDHSTNPDTLKNHNIRALLKPHQFAGLSAAMSMGIKYLLAENYDGFILMDGNNKDDPAFVKNFIEKLQAGYDYVQGSRFINPGHAINTPNSRNFLIKYIHAPVISFACGRTFTDTTNGFRAFSKKFLTSDQMKKDLYRYSRYELPYVLSWTASYFGFKTTEIPVIRKYPESGEIVTKIKGVRRHWDMLKPLLLVAAKKLLNDCKPSNKTKNV